MPENRANSGISKKALSSCVSLMLSSSINSTWMEKPQLATLSLRQPVSVVSVRQKEFAGVASVDYTGLRARKSDFGFGQFTDDEFGKLLFRCIAREAAAKRTLIFTTDACLAGCTDVTPIIEAQLKNLSQDKFAQPPQWSNCATLSMIDLIASWPAAQRGVDRVMQINNEAQTLVEIYNHQYEMERKRGATRSELTRLKHRLQSQIDQHNKQATQEGQSLENGLIRTLINATSEYANKKGLYYIFSNEYAAIQCETVTQPITIKLHNLQANAPRMAEGSNPYNLAVIKDYQFYQAMDDLGLREGDKTARLRAIAESLRKQKNFRAVLTSDAVVCGARDITSDAVELLGK